MHLLYVDESGNISDENQQYFVLAGFSIYERQAWWLAQELDKVAMEFDPANPESIELHGSQMLAGRKYWRGFPLKDRIKAIEDALIVLAKSNPKNRLFACVIKKSPSIRDAVEYAFEQLASRFDQYLMRLHRSHDTQRGVIIFDKSTYESTIQSLATDFRTIGHKWGVLRNLAEVPLFLDSKASRLIQLADLVAYAVFRHFEKNDDRFYKLIEMRFDKEGGINHGLHIKQ